jgi:biotin---protein ligase
MSLLPAPILSLASQQLAGRGRGNNVWLSPLGCLQFSLFLRTSLATLPASKLVFIQYLFGLAVVEACRETAILGQLGERVRLKWPNDLYVVMGSGDPHRKKIGGILVNTNLSGNQAEIVIGGRLSTLMVAQPILTIVHHRRLWAQCLQSTSNYIARTIAPSRIRS